MTCDGGEEKRETSNAQRSMGRRRLLTQAYSRATHCRQMSDSNLVASGDVPEERIWGYVIGNFIKQS